MKSKKKNAGKRTPPELLQSPASIPTRDKESSSKSGTVDEKAVRQPPYSSSSDALKTIGSAFDEWSSILTNHSIQATYAIIAANWAIHGSTNSILNNPYSRVSIASAILFIGMNLAMNFCMIHLHYRRYLYAEENPERWEREYAEYQKSASKNAWPYTDGIEKLGAIHRLLKIVFPITASALLILSLFFPPEYHKHINSDPTELICLCIDTDTDTNTNTNTDTDTDTES